MVIARTKGFPVRIVRLRGHDAVAPCACTQRHGRIDDIGRSSDADARELPGFACSLVVERNGLGVRCAEQSCEPGLSAPVAPHLADRTRRHGQTVPVLNVAQEERDDPAPAYSGWTLPAGADGSGTLSHQALDRRHHVPGQSTVLRSPPASPRAALTGRRA